MFKARFKRRAKVVPNQIQFGSTVARHWHNLVSKDEPWSSLIHSLGVYKRDDITNQRSNGKIKNDNFSYLLI